MLKHLTYLLLFCTLGISILHAQTTDVSIVIEAQDVSNNPISQITIGTDFQYVITVQNSGDDVNNSAISIMFDMDLTINSISSQNNSGGASDTTGITTINNVISGTVASLPNNSSVELLVSVTAPITIGGVATNGSITVPSEVTDTNMSNNQSIISIDVIEIPVDFSVIHSQINPPQGTGISNWGDSVTYEFTITNNSTIDFPISEIRGLLNLTSDFNAGQPSAELMSIQCISATNGTQCPDVSGINGQLVNVQGMDIIFSNNDNVLITSGGSITFEIVYQYTNTSCSTNSDDNIVVNSYIEVVYAEETATSNEVETILLDAEPCLETDVCIETFQVNPIPGGVLDYGEEITFETVICNNGPLDAQVRIQFLKASAALDWNFVSILCTNTTGSVSCTDFTIISSEQLWVINDFVLPADATITIETIVFFKEPNCSVDDNNIPISILSSISITEDLLDSDVSNNLFSNLVVFPPADLCDDTNSNDLSIVKVQTNPVLPFGIDDDNTAPWGDVTYEITITNSGIEDMEIRLQDFLPQPQGGNLVFGTLQSVDCVSVTGSAQCFPITNANIGVQFDGLTDTGESDIFWEILPEDNWQLPADSSVTFEVVVFWEPECSVDSRIGSNAVNVSSTNGVEDTDLTNNFAIVSTYFAPCIDLIIQTYPEFTQVSTNQSFNWIIDISNSITSFSATNVVVESALDPEFIINGPIACSVSSGNATCPSTFNITGSFITGEIPTMDAGSTVTIIIPVQAPNINGAFNNTAEAIPSIEDNEELTPETNISINSVQVISPILDKVFMPEAIIEGEETELIFTVFNSPSNPEQTNISFTDNLPSGLTISQPPIWIDDNGCTSDFIGDIGDDFVGVNNLQMPAGVTSCSFSVAVTSSIIGIYTNNEINFNSLNNIDVSITNASLEVIVDPSNVDIQVLKIAEPTEVVANGQVTFTITTTNLGTTIATGIEIIDQLPTGYDYVTFSVSEGSFNESTFTWSIPSLAPLQSETLDLTVNVVSQDDLLNVAFLQDVNETDRDISNNEDDAFVEISNCLDVPEGISPNDDMKNDILIIPCIEDYPNNTLKIFNRYGLLIYEASNYLNEWDGRPNCGVPDVNNRLPVGVYYYILEIDQVEPLTGYVYLNY